jgi:hypothetical protein
VVGLFFMLEAITPHAWQNGNSRRKALRLSEYTFPSFARFADTRLTRVR